MLKSLFKFSTQLPSKINFITDNVHEFQIVSKEKYQRIPELLEILSRLGIEPNQGLNSLTNEQKGNTYVTRIVTEKTDKVCISQIVRELNTLYGNVEVDVYPKVEVPWFPQVEYDIRSIGTQMVVDDEINKDHPQFTDQVYRERRESIGQASLMHMIGTPVPLVDYTEQEQRTWRETYQKLKQRCLKVMSKRYLEKLNKVEKDLGYKHQIPQLRDIDEYLRAETNFKIKATHATLSQREFLNCLAHRVFCCTQYIRHHGFPEYTPEPDIIHEFVGHIPLFVDQEIADLQQQFGIFSCGALATDIKKLGTLYWSTVEFGGCLEDGEIKAYGAGIASSFGESDNFSQAKYEMLDIFKHAVREYPIQTVQPTYIIAESIDNVFQRLIEFGKSLDKPFSLVYDYKTNALKCNRRIRTHLNDQ